MRLLALLPFALLIPSIQAQNNAFDPLSTSLKTALQADRRATLIPLREAADRTLVKVRRPSDHWILCKQLDLAADDRGTFVAYRRLRQVVSSEGARPEAGLNRLVLGFDADWVAQLKEGRAASEVPDNVLRAAIEVSAMRGSVLKLLAEQPSNVQISLRAQPILQYKDPKDGLIHSLSLPASVKLRQAPGEQMAVRSKATAVEGFPKATDGPLDFGEGQVLQLDSILRKAAAKFDVNFEVDLHQRASPFFIKGKWTLDQLRQALNLTAQVNAPREVGKDELQARWRAILQALVSDAEWDEEDLGTLTDLMRGRTVALSDLQQARPGWGFLQGIPPGVKITLTLGITLSVKAPGVSPLEGASATIGGKPVAATAPNEAGFTLVP